MVPCLQSKLRPNMNRQELKNEFPVTADGVVLIQNFSLGWD